MIVFDISYDVLQMEITVLAGAHLRFCSADFRSAVPKKIQNRWLASTLISSHTGPVNSRIWMVLFLCAALSAQAQDFALDNLPTLHKFQSHRITSADPTGGNDDWRQLEPGQTLIPELLT
jgi:hypothetical protein